MQKVNVNGRLRVQKYSKDLCLTQPLIQNTLPGGNTGQRLPAPRPALPSFRVEMALCNSLLLLIDKMTDKGPRCTLQIGFLKAMPYECGL